MFDHFGKLLMTFGVLFIVLGGFITLISRISSMGRLPGDIFIQRGNFTFYFPVATSILISIVLSLILTLLFRR